MTEANEKTTISLYKVGLLISILKRNISIEETTDAEEKRVLGIAQSIDIAEMRHYLDKLQETGDKQWKK